MIFFAIAGLFFNTAQAVEVEDMVLVSTSNPFLIDIFETSCDLADRMVRGACTWGDVRWKPLRANFDMANSVCEAMGKRLPTLDEWMEAATNMGRNSNYTLKDDSLRDASGNLLINIQNRYDGSVDTYDFSKLGIDAVGTVGMSGNRAEWVINGNSYAQCGRQYETQDENLLQLSNICITDYSQMANTATARCVMDYDVDMQIVYSNRVNGELEEHINSRMVTRKDSLSDSLIDSNPYTEMENNNRHRLDQPDPWFRD